MKLKKTRLKLIKPFRILLAIFILSIIISSTFVSPTLVSATPSTQEWEYYTTGGSVDSADIYAGTYIAETFTVGVASHSITNIYLLAKATGTPGTVTLAIQDTSAGSPINPDLATATLDGNTFGTSYSYQTFVFSPPLSINATTKYAMVVRCVGGSVSNYINIYLDASSTYTGGSILDSTDKGFSWSATTTSAAQFKVYGGSLLQVVNAAVFNNYTVDSSGNHTINDTLITANIINTYVPYYPDQIPNKYFSLQLLDTTGTIILASVPITGYGDGVASIYISEDQTTQLQYGAAYVVRLIGNFAGSPTNATYVLQDGDWNGTNLQLLDQWCILTANKMGTYYTNLGVTTTFVTQVQVKTLGFLPSGTNSILNEAGGAIFNTGIPGLSTIRPNLFQVLVGTIQNNSQTLAISDLYGQGNDVSDIARMEANLGPTITADIINLSTFLQTDPKSFMVFAWIIIYAIFAFWLINANQIAIALVGGFPWMMYGVYLGIIDVVVIGTIAAVSALYIVWHFWWTRVI